MAKIVNLSAVPVLVAGRWIPPGGELAHPTDEEVSELAAATLDMTGRLNAFVEAMAHVVRLGGLTRAGAALLLRSLAEDVE